MRPGPPRGETGRLEVVVTPERTTRHGGSTGDAVYGTAALVDDVEQLCRQVLAPHLEDGEEAVGTRVELLHRAPVAAGETVTLEATVAAVTPRALTCEISVRHAGRLVARGSFEQEVVDVRARAEEVARWRMAGDRPPDPTRPG